MAKRFIDTELWQKVWFQELSLLEKTVVLYIFGNCDCAGVWNANYRLASFVIGENINEDTLKNINAHKKQFEFLENGDVFILDFISFQYGSLSENCKPHKTIIEKLKKHNLYERVCKGLTNPYNTLQEKEKEKEKEKDKEQDKEKEEIKKEEKEKIRRIEKVETINTVNELPEPLKAKMKAFCMRTGAKSIIGSS